MIQVMPCRHVSAIRGDGVKDLSVYAREPATQKYFQFAGSYPLSIALNQDLLFPLRK
jgi:hypothetical protein